MKVTNESLQEHSRSLIPEGVLRLAALWRCVLKQVGCEALNIVVALQINKGVVAVALFHIDKVKNLDVVSVLFQEVPVSRSSSPFGSSTTKLVFAFMMFGLAKNLVLPAPEPPHTSTFRFLLCFRPSSPIATFCVRILFSVLSLLAYFLLTEPAVPHLAEPCSSRRL